MNAIVVDAPAIPEAIMAAARAKCAKSLDWRREWLAKKGTKLTPEGIADWEMYEARRLYAATLRPVSARIDALRERIEALGIDVDLSPEARCFLSISCYTPPFPGRRGAVAIHPENNTVAGTVEGLALQLALIKLSGGPKRFRLTDTNYGDAWIRRAWDLAAMYAIPRAEWVAALAEGLDGPALAERFSVTERLVRLRWRRWHATPGAADAGLHVPIDTSITLRSAVAD